MKTNYTSPVHITWKFTASPEVVFDAWLNPDVMRQWLFVSPTNEITHINTDQRIGGKFSILERNGGEEIDQFGEYREIQRPTRLVFTLEVPKHFPGVTCVTIDIIATATGCLMKFSQEGVKRETTEGNWRNMFHTLASLLEEAK